MLNSSIFNKRFLFGIVLITLTFSLSSCRYLNEKGLFLGKNRKELLLWAQKDSIRVADSLKNIMPVKDLAPEVKQDSVVKVIQEKPVEEVSSKMYYLIIGSFASPENAKTLAKEYNDQGYKTNIIKTINSSGRSIHLVSIKAFDNYSDAVSYRNNYHSKTSSNAWVYPSK
jgi:hypothetical protein